MQYQNAVDSAEVEARPLVVDLDGTLINTDLLLETALAFLARYPLKAYKLILWAVAGKQVLKHQIAQHIEVDAATLSLQCKRHEFRIIK